jgi:hypothetical protein
MLRPSTAVPPGDVDPGTRLSVTSAKAELADRIAKHARTRALVASRTEVPLVIELSIHHIVFCGGDSWESANRNNRLKNYLMPPDDSA